MRVASLANGEGPSPWLFQQIAAPEQVCSHPDRWPQRLGSFSIFLMVLELRVVQLYREAVATEPQKGDFSLGHVGKRVPVADKGPRVYFRLSVAQIVY